MLDKFERFVEEIEGEPEIVEVKEKMLVTESKIKVAADELTWDMLLEWESLWGEYVEICIRKFLLSQGVDIV
ncbi:hypothetical protein [Tumebacillus flagellatus]|uniref:Uncharacterized protein n=1 Tax=Tumebacillus flagellatus TaxID=1157490 RepID=A0A074LSU8_9BACL|nr:hypothetical protein [Tumebacillus flagellatus]KEO83560.1 hypothetical protein EL26_09100 [Tumebacillus flagellatus]